MASRKEQGAALGGRHLEGSVQDPALDLNRVEGMMVCQEQTKVPWDAVAGRGSKGQGARIQSGGRTDVGRKIMNFTFETSLLKSL